jgi:pyruvate/2-oxoglutarate dehydrogenase complex dihydrolipoamide dehydrogenase (E3) component
MSVAITDRRLVGGEGFYYGCVPSKALLWPMELAAGVSRMPGLELRGPINAAEVFARRDKFVEHYDDTGEVGKIGSMPATFVRGQGCLAGPSRVEVTAPDGGIRALQARYAVIVATGSDPLIPEVPGMQRRGRGPTVRQPAPDRCRGD